MATSTTRRVVSTLPNTILVWLRARPGWHTLHEIRREQGLTNDGSVSKLYPSGMPSLRGVVGELASRGEVETQGGWDKTFEVRAVE